MKKFYEKLITLCRTIINLSESKRENEYERGVQFAKEEIELYKGNRQKLWYRCNTSFCNESFGHGWADELRRQGIRHPLDPLGE